MDIPIPKPNKGESRDKFISRCMSAIKGEDKPQKQKVAICFQTWRDSKKKSFSFFLDSVEFKSIEGTPMFKGYLSTSSLDKVGDIALPACLDDMEKQISNGLVGYAPMHMGSIEHDTVIENNPFKIPLSRISKAVRDSKGLYVEGPFNQEHPEFEKYWRMAQNGFLGGLSIEFIADDYELKGDKRILKKVTLLGYGHSPRPINPECMAEVFTKSLNIMDEILETKIEGDETMSDEEIKAEPSKAEKKADVEVKQEEKVEKKVETQAEPVAEEKVEEPEKSEEVKAKPETKGLTKEEVKAILKEELKALTTPKVLTPKGSEEVKSETTDIATLVARSYGW